MKQLFRYALLALSLLLCGSSMGFTEGDTEWGYNISMNIRSASGELLPASAISPEQIRSGLTVSAYNSCLADNSMTLVLLCNGHVIPYTADKCEAEPQQQTYFTIPAEGEVTFTIYPILKDALVHPQEVTYLHVILIGLRDLFPQDPLDSVQSFSTVVSLPIQCDTSLDTLPSPFLPIEEATTPASSISNENLFYGIQIRSINGTKRNSTLFTTEAGPLSLRFAILPDEPDVSVCCFADNVVQSLNGYDGIRIHALKGMSYEGVITLELSPGTHQLYLLCVPLFHASPCFVTSEKISVEVLP